MWRKIYKFVLQCSSNEITFSFDNNHRPRFPHHTALSCCCTTFELKLAAHSIAVIGDKKFIFYLNLSERDCDSWFMANNHRPHNWIIVLTQLKSSKSIIINIFPKNFLIWLQNKHHWIDLILLNFCLFIQFYVLIF